jgi:L-seryl-tRNA(Ser) seleniumtransferase
MSSDPAARARPPSVEAVLKELRQRLDEKELIQDAELSGSLADLARTTIDDERGNLAAGQPPRSVEALADATEWLLESFVDPDAAVPEHVINATGVILHTNLGRAEWPDVAVETVQLAAGWGALEVDLETGRRGRRFHLAEDHLVALTGAESAMVLNNNAAAVAIAVGLAGKGGVAVSRGELVEIGGGVRIPEIVERTGARLIEVGATNRTRTADFAPVLRSGEASMVLRVHPSNFTMAGFIEEPDAAALASLAHEHGAIVVDDLGSGALLDTARFGLLHEPMPSERLGLGADIVTFSGDKLIGGPQAGMLVGRADLVERLRRDPLARAMRPDKVILSAVAATLGLYRAGVAPTEIPVWRRIATPKAELRERAEWIVRMCAGFFAPDASVEMVEVDSPVGGGSLPGQTIPSWGVAIPFPSPTGASGALRTGQPSILTRVVDDAVVFDLRTVTFGQDGEIVRRIGEVAGGSR